MRLDNKYLLRTKRVYLEDATSFAESIRKNRVKIQKAAYKKALEIVRRVKKEGDKAILYYTEKFDGATLKGKIRVDESEIKESLNRVSSKFIDAVVELKENVENVQRKILSSLNITYKERGLIIRLKPRPIDSVGCYVPGGRAFYPSTVVMTAGIASVSSVPRIVLCTPPRSDGTISEHVLAASYICGVDEVYSIGGAQAIAAMAYGTESIKKVRKIVGPGGYVVSSAKKIVSKETEIDFVAGPTELVVIADDDAVSKYVALDLIAQAEHGKDTMCGLITFSKEKNEEIQLEILKEAEKIGRKEIVNDSLRHGFAAICDKIKTAAEIVNALAPEHVQIMGSSQEKISSMIRNTGIKLVGNYGASAASDYILGTSHVIPTDGYAAIKSPLSAIDMVRLDWEARLKKEYLAERKWIAEELSAAEGLRNHYLSILSRVNS